MRTTPRKQNALYGYAPSSNLGVTTLSNGKGGTITVTNGSVLNFGGTMKFGLYPTVGVGLDFLLQLQNCCPPGSLGMCFNTVEKASNCK